jgi:hypothetical protein
VVHDVTGSYDASFLAAIVVLVVAGVVTLALPRPVRAPAVAAEEVVVP